MWGLIKRYSSLMQTPLFKWYVTRLVVKNGHQQTCAVIRLDYVLKLRTPF